MTKKVLVTGSSGFLGRHLVRHLSEDMGHSVLTLRHSDDPSEGGDLLRREQAHTVVENAVQDGPLDCVYHLAGYNGGIAFNIKNPADIFYRNTVMGLNLLDACCRHHDRVGKVVLMVASCGYPDKTWWHQRENPLRGAGSPDILHETEFLTCQPHASVACHGLAKRNLQLAARFCRRQYDLDAVCVCPTTLYGPGDSFDPERTKLVGALVKKFVDGKRAGLDRVEVWGTGRPLRELLYVEDAARLIPAAAEFYCDSNWPLNLGTGQEVTVEELAVTVAELAGFRGGIFFDHSKPDGQMRKRLDVETLRHLLPEFTPTPLREGLAKTIRWYEENHA